MGLAGCTGGSVGTGTAPTEVATSSLSAADGHASRHLKYSVKPTPIERLARQRQLIDAAPTANAAAGTPVTMTYSNGPLLASVEVYAVFWGPNVDPATVKGIPTFFTGITTGAMMDLLAEYNEPGFTIGNGTFKGAVVDADAPMPAANTPLDDSQVQAEIVRLIDTGKLPANDGKNIFMMYFPPGIAIGHGSEQSCVQFCGYHNYFQRNGTAVANNVYYAIMPDHGSGGCETGCGGHKAVLDNLQRTSSHELSEAISDAVPGAGWYDSTGGQGEIGDVCALWDGVTNGFVTQTEWSQKTTSCRQAVPATSNNIAVTISNDTGVGTTGGTVQYTISSTGSGSGTLQLGAPDLDLTTATGFGGVWNPAGTGGMPPSIPINGGSATLTLNIPTTFSNGVTVRSDSLNFHIDAADSENAHYGQQVALNYVGAAPTLASAAPTGGKGGDMIVLTGTNISASATAFLCKSSTSCGTTARTPITGAYIASKGTQFQLTLPGHKAGTAYIGLSNPNDATVAKLKYTYAAKAAPTVTKVDPPTGPLAAGTFVVVSGTGFDTNAGVSVAGTALPVYAYDGNPGFLFFDNANIGIVMPAGTANGPVTITITNGDGKTAPGMFTYGTPSPPEIASLSQNSGPTAGGQYVTIFGQNIDPTATVTLDNVAAKMESNSPGSFVGIITPPHAAGQVNLVVANADGQTSTVPYTYSDATAMGDGGTGTDDGGTGAAGADMADGTGVGGNGGAGGSAGGGGTTHPGGTNGIKSSSGCSFAGDGATATGSLLLVLACLGLALRRRRA